MNKNRTGIQGLAVLLLSALAVSGCEMLPAKTDRPVVQNLEQDHDTTMEGQRPATDSAGAMSMERGAPASSPRRVSSVVHEVQNLVQTRQAQELRTTYNGNFGASLLFKPDTLTYYVVLFQQKDVWQVVKTTDRVKAEQTYQSYAKESGQLAEAELSRIQLQAEYTSIEKEVLSKADELTALQQDIEVRRRHEAMIKSEQAQVRGDVELLAQQEREAREQLQALQRQIKALQAQR